MAYRNVYALALQLTEVSCLQMLFNVGVLPGLHHVSCD